MNKNIQKELLKIAYEGGITSLTALEANIEQISKKLGGDKTLSLSDFLSLISTFKAEYKKILDDPETIKQGCSLKPASIPSEYIPDPSFDDDMQILNVHALLSKEDCENETVRYWDAPID